MKRYLFAALVAIAALAAPTFAHALGADHPKGPVGASSWSKEVTALVNRPNRVHGYFVNWHDVLFYSGDAKEVNAFLKEFVAAPGAVMTVSFCGGKGTAASPWKSGHAPEDCDWQLDVIGGTPSLRIWVGGKVKLADVVLPEGLEPVALPTVLEVLSGSDYDVQMRAIEAMVAKWREAHPKSAGKKPEEKKPTDKKANGAK